MSIVIKNLVPREEEAIREVAEKITEDVFYRKNATILTREKVYNLIEPLVRDVLALNYRKGSSPNKEEKSNV